MDKIKSKPVKVICPYCEDEAELTDGREVYPHRPDLFDLKFWVCRDCKAYVGCHKRSPRYGNGTVPLGNLATRELRKWRNKAHAAFDKLWKDGPLTRTSAYFLLSNSLGVSVKMCHIGQFSIAQCEKTIEISNRNKFSKGGESDNQER